MSHTNSGIAVLTILLSPSIMFAASSQESVAAEYQQVRKIALRDPKVRAAYAAADQRLDDKIVSIDPSLAGYVKSRGNPGAQAAAVEKPAAAKPTTKSAVHKPVEQSRRQISHVVAKGDTLSSIAEKYRVSVADIRGANRIENERKLPVGQTLTIPLTPVTHSAH
jgi:LysM repeat protein